MNGRIVTVAILLGILAALAISAQLGLAIAILNGGSTKIRTAHQHTGFLTVALSLLYVALSLTILIQVRNRKRP